jgi:hypothetical protein
MKRKVNIAKSLSPFFHNLFLYIHLFNLDTLIIIVVIVNIYTCSQCIKTLIKTFNKMGPTDKCVKEEEE